MTCYHVYFSFLDVIIAGYNAFHPWNVPKCTIAFKKMYTNMLNETELQIMQFSSNRDITSVK